MKTKFIYISLLLSLNLLGQNNNQLTLSTVQTQGGEIVAGESIKLSTGFLFTSSAAKSLNLKIDAAAYDFGSTTVKDPNASKEVNASQYKNYILTRSYMQDDGKRYLDQIQYFDGLGRENQIVQRGITPGGADLVSLHECDAFNNKVKSWLPVAIASNNGKFVSESSVQTNAISSNRGDQRPFNQTIYESSPLNRIRASVGAGQAWYTKREKVKIKTEYLKNSYTIKELQCREFFHEGTRNVGLSTQKILLWGPDYFRDGAISVEKITYNDSSIQYRFKDYDGILLLIRNVINGKLSDTYFIRDYDYYETLYSFILLPEGVEKCPFGELSDNQEILEYMYAFCYNEYNFDIKHPNSGWHVGDLREYESIISAFVDEKEDVIGSYKALKTYFLANGGIGTVIDGNPLGEAYLTCARYRIMNEQLSRYDNYENSELFVTLMLDEDDNLMLEFKDKLGRVVLSRQISASEKYDTYYVYDNFGNLRYVLPPMAIDKLTKYADNDPVMKQYAYIYKYDNRNRCISKKLPGVEPVLYVYDKANRLIFTQDGEQHSKTPTKEWTFNKYDDFGRLIISGIYRSNETQANLTTKFGNIVFKEKNGSGSYNYTWTNLKETDVKVTDDVLLVNYYDNHDNIPKVFDYATVLKYTEKANYGKKHSSAKGMLVGTRIKNIDSSGKTIYSRAGEIATIMYYDNRGRMIQTHSTNHLGGVDSEFTAYNFTSQPTQKLHVHTATGKATQTELYAYDYDHAGRLLTTKHKLDTGSETLVASNTYDELGRLKTNKKGNNANLTTTYDYNIRSWTTSMKSHHLHFNLDYTHGGNIKNQAWTQGGKTRKYNFEYDALSRLKDANYVGVGKEAYAVHYTYDKHGNIATIRREGKTGVDSYDMVDNLAMSYNGNQLIKVRDAVKSPSIEGSADFINHVGDKGEMQYNANGALTVDTHKGISNIGYNSLNLPTSMVIGGTGIPVSGSIEYTYSASGAKLRTVHTEDQMMTRSPIVGVNAYSTANKITTKTDYIGNRVYENDKLKRTLIAGGYIEAGQYHYYLTDHLGNNRAVANKDGGIIQQTQYYPFGMAFADATNKAKQPYKYNGKELDTRLLLNTYDYSARYMDPAIGRFTSVDPHAENYYSWSPYAYAMNNPLKYIDPTGMDTVNIDHQGKISSILAGGNDVMNITNKKGGVVSKDFGTGVFASVKKGEKSESGDFEYDIFQINGEDNATSVFEFLSDNFTSTNNGNEGIEFSRTKWKTNDGETLNLVGTSYERMTERGTGQYMRKPNMNNGLLGGKYHLIKDDHNHPSGSNSASQADVIGKNEKATIANYFGVSVPTTRIYVPKIHKPQQKYWSY